VSLNFSKVFSKVFTKACSKTSLVLLVCLTFVGQSMASAVMPYQMMNMKGMNTEQTHNMENMTQGSHPMSTDSIANDPDEEEGCCAKTCNCCIGGCSSVATLNKAIIIDNLIFDYPAKIHSITSLVQSQHLTSLYRPPILS